MRKSLSMLIAATTAAATLLAGSSLAGPAAAQAGECRWQLPNYIRIVQGNKHTIDLTYNASEGYWKAKAYNRREHVTTSTEVVFTSVTPRLVKFIITWFNDTAGIYTGTIDDDGFASGITRDRFNPQSKTTWDMTKRMRCR